MQLNDIAASTIDNPAAAFSSPPGFKQPEPKRFKVSRPASSITITGASLAVLLYLSSRVFIPRCIFPVSPYHKPATAVVGWATREGGGSWREEDKNQATKPSLLWAGLGQLNCCNETHVTGGINILNAELWWW
ncbi:hypothetical protein GUJ93_ZPchr0001g32341 [Zizania palustris]|uniref:Uncharacterized protein n=1 Tax=Zizania palustris TaxID=103762 RepID=A0A8J5REV4_ZIZPA|nr:hypothetical protein GUJ93_ZPchr0001g32341 [Zizania palustris]